MEEFSQKSKEYFSNIDYEIKKCYDVATSARQKGFDPDIKVEIPLARNMAERVEGLIAVVAPQIKDSGVSQRIRQLEEKYGSQNWKIAFIISEEIAKEKFCKFKDKHEAMEISLRIGLAYITNGVVSSPLEGFIRLELKKRKDGKEYFCLYFGGPIRSAGTTATCIFVAVADYIRIKMNYAPYDPSENEIKRTFAELEHFHERITNLQYFPSEKEVSYITSHLPIQIDGDASEKIDVPNYKDLPRVSTNKLRNGFCLVMAEGLSQKFAKFWGKFSKWYKEMDMDHWIFLEEFVKLQKEIKSKSKIKKSSSEKIIPDYTYLKDIVAGRPILGYPLKTGTFRLRIGRARTSGFSADAIHPATMIISDSFLAIGTQLKTERPGKATTLSSCDTIEGPIVKLKNDEVVFVDTIEKAEEIKKDIKEIIFLGDILISYGDMLNRGHSLVPLGYNEDWWNLELEKSTENKKDYEKYLNDTRIYPKFCEAREISIKYNIPLHPRYTYHWNDLNKKQIIDIILWLEHSVVKENKIILPLIEKLSEYKRAVELAGVPHKVANGEYIVIEDDWAEAFKLQMGLNGNYDKNKLLQQLEQSEKPLDFINKLSNIKIKDKSGTFIGSRMGRPEKAKMRKLTGSPHSLFPVGKEGGRLRCFQEALSKGKVTAQFQNLFCVNCNKRTLYTHCHTCNGISIKLKYCKICGNIEKECEHRYTEYFDGEIPIREYFDSVLNHLGIRSYPQLVKGVRGTSNKEHILEHLAKGILRAINGIYVNKDGTVRYDMTEMPLTHFKPKEIGVQIERLKKMGYTNDIYGNELQNENQILELKCQDLVLPSCPETLDEGADYVLSRVGKFLDDLLEKFYKLPKYYNIQKKEDIIGHLVVGLSPHTASGIVGRIIGFSKTQVMLAHPLYHSIMRRDADGDEAGVMLLLDALINFSPKLLSGNRGATQDEPLVLTSTIIPSEVDDMVFDMDIAFKYPLELYEYSLDYKMPSEINVITLNQFLRTEKQYEGYGFTHDTTDFNNGVRCSSYKTIPSMQEKVEKQMALCEKLRAVDERDVARLIIERHFIRDIKGNLRKFSMQEFRCVKCNEKYRRPSLRGNCIKCKGKIIFTISEGSVLKYLEPSLALAEKYKVSKYLQQTLELVKQRAEMLFGKEKDRQDNLNKWFTV